MFENVEVNGVVIFSLILGITEALKEVFDLSGKANIACSIIVGAVLFGTAQALAMGLLPEVVVPWINLVIYALGGGLSVSGYYRLLKRAGGALVSAVSR